MDLSIKIKNAKAFENYIMREMAGRINKAMKNAEPYIGRRIKELVKDAIALSPTTQQLIDSFSRIRGELGVVDAQNSIGHALAQWLASYTVLSVPVRIFGGQLVGGYSFNIVSTNWGNVTSLSTSSYTSYPSNVQVEWLKQLLEGGYSFFPSNYRVIFNPGLLGNHSRTGLAIMRKSSHGYKVPVEHAGTENDNFVTRALEPLQNQFEQIIGEEVGKRI